MAPAVRFAVLYIARPQGTWSPPALMLERTEYTREAFQSMLDRAGIDPGHPLRAWVAQERWPGDLWVVPHEAVAGIGGVACVAPQSSTVPRLEPITRTADRLGPPLRVPVKPPVLPGEQVILGGVAVGEPLSADGLANLDRAVAEDAGLLTVSPAFREAAEVEANTPIAAGARLGDSHRFDGRNHSVEVVRGLNKTTFLGPDLPRMDFGVPPGEFEAAVRDMEEIVANPQATAEERAAAEGTLDELHRIPRPGRPGEVFQIAKHLLPERLFELKAGDLYSFPDGSVGRVHDEPDAKYIRFRLISSPGAE